MSKLYVQLVQDHVHLHQLLETLRCELSGYDQEDWYQPNLPLIVEALDYIRVYPEVFHHPLEEHVFDYLLEQDLVDRNVVARLVSQHDEMEGETDLLQEQFNELADNVSAPFDGLRESLDHYLRLQLHHLAIENKEVFPAIEQLDEREWREITRRLALHHIPLFCDYHDQEQFTNQLKILIT